MLLRLLLTRLPVIPHRQVVDRRRKDRHLRNVRDVRRTPTRLYVLFLFPFCLVLIWFLFDVDFDVGVDFLWRYYY